MGIKQKGKKGFTIIEVVLVLAIAGLIFMMVFIALPALQRNQRDAQRKNYLSTAMTAVQNYASNNRGSLPTFNDTFIKNYLIVDGDSFVDPSGLNKDQTLNADGVERYVFAATTSGSQSAITGPFSDHQNIIYPTTGATCGPDGTTVDGSNRKVAFRMMLEGGGVACRD